MRRPGDQTTMSPLAPSRRTVVKALASAAASSLARPALAQAAPRVVVVGGGFGGASCTRELRRAGLSVTLVEASPTLTDCPLSNAVIAGLLDLKAQEFGYDGLRKEGLTVVHQDATAVDPQGRRVTLGDGVTLDYDR